MSNYVVKVQKLKDKNVLSFYEEKENSVNLVYIQKYGEDDYGCWVIDISKNDFPNAKNIDELLELILFDTHCSDKYQDEGGSSRGTLIEIIEEVKEIVLNIDNIENYF